MRYQPIISLQIFLLMTGCSDLNAPDCLQSAGDFRSFILKMDDFNEIEINGELNVTISSGIEQKVELIIAENLFSDVSAEVIKGKFVISDNNSCRWVRPYQFPELIITATDLIRIRQNGGGLIKSEGALNYERLGLISERRTGDFELEVNCQELRIVNNNLSNYKISGSVNKLVVGFFAGDGRFEGAYLDANIVDVFQRGTNDIIVVANDKLTGRIISNGNIIYTKTKPPVLDVSIEGKGKLIYKE